MIISKPLCINNLKVTVFNCFWWGGGIMLAEHNLKISFQSVECFCDFTGLKTALSMSDWQIMTIKLFMHKGFHDKKIKVQLDSSYISITRCC